MTAVSKNNAGKRSRVLSPKYLTSATPPSSVQNPAGWVQYKVNGMSKVYSRYRFWEIAKWSKADVRTVRLHLIRPPDDWMPKGKVGSARSAAMRAAWPPGERGRPPGPNGGRSRRGKRGKKGVAGKHGGGGVYGDGDVGEEEEGEEEEEEEELMGMEEEEEAEEEGREEEAEPPSSPAEEEEMHFKMARGHSMTGSIEAKSKVGGNWGNVGWWMGGWGDGG